MLSIVLGGLAAGEAKKMLMGEEVSEDPIIYNKFSGIDGKEKTEENDTDYSGKKVLVVGAGALGNFVAMGLAELGVGKVDIIDDDTIEDTNLNRQILYYDSVGKGKAKTLARKTGYMNPGISINAFEKKFDENFDGNYDLIFDCVDNFATRALMSDFAARKKIPLVSGGTDWKGGQVAVYVPGKACLDCQMDLKKSAKKRDESQSCIYAPNPSVIFTNQAIAGMMVNEAVRIFENTGILRGRRGYDSEMNGRLGKTDTTGECEHG
ncbi:MAG: ThiF family adenylyltransferase [Candidatus Aenigmarchaeota archaeon]|nr:ThiF family adenylyltransferase [Candidatus Aenigmarchaeota archaeon]